MTDFAGFWSEYPRKVGKAQAMQAYSKALRGTLRLQLSCGLGPATHEEIIQGLERYKRDKPDYADWKHGSTFLNSVSWIDEGGSEVIEPDRDNTAELAMMRKAHEAGYEMHPSLAREHDWAEYGSAGLSSVVVKLTAAK